MKKLIIIIALLTACKKQANDRVIQYKIYTSFPYNYQTYSVTPTKELTQRTGWEAYFFATPKEDIAITSTVNENRYYLFGDITKNYMVITRLNVGDNTILTRDTIHYSGWVASYKYKH